MNPTIAEIKESVDLLAEVEKALGPGKRYGRWVLFRCPFPGHENGDRTPSLAVTPDNGWYYCFACKASGDVVTWLREYQGLSWKEIFGLAPYTGTVSQNSTAPHPSIVPKPMMPVFGEPLKAPTEAATRVEPPAGSWQARCRAFVEHCEKQLWGTPGSNARVFREPSPAELLTPLEYLRKRRGLSDRTIQRYRLGYNPESHYEPYADWGLLEEAGSNGVWLPRGITIPCMIHGEIWYTNIRQPEGEPRYLKVKGSRGALFGADNLRGAELILLTEGEFDCMLADQLMADVAGIATFGSASKHIDLAIWGAYLLPARAITVALDSDEAGNAGLNALVALSPQIYPMRVPVLNPGDKDITDYVLAGGDLWEWYKYNLHQEGIDALFNIPYDPNPQGLEKGAAFTVDAKKVRTITPIMPERIHD